MLKVSYGDATAEVMLLRDQLGGHLGIGTTTPSFGLGLSANYRVLGVTGDGTDSAYNAGMLILANTRATPSSGDKLGNIFFVSSYGGTQYTPASINAVLTGSGGANNFGGALAFITKGDNIAGNTERMRIDSTGNVGIGTPSPKATLRVYGGALCVSGDAGSNDCSGGANTPGTIFAKTTTVAGADYAEYFHAEDSDLAPGDIVGLNAASGLARLYQVGDHLLSIVSTKPGIVGNSKLAHEHAVLVALLGQVPFHTSQVRIEGDTVKTLDGKRLGYRLASGDVHLKMTADDEIAELKAENARLKADNSAVKAYICGKDPQAPLCAQ